MKNIVCLMILTLASFCYKNDDTEYQECFVEYRAAISEVCNCAHNSCYIEYPISKEEYRRLLLSGSGESCNYVQIEVLDNQENVEGYLQFVGKKDCF